jgi:O-antigen ligase
MSTSLENMNERRPCEEAGAQRIEAFLVLGIGLSLPFADFPFLVRHRFGLDLAHAAGAVLLLWTAARTLLRRRPLPARDLVAGVAALLLAAAAPWALPRADGFVAAALLRTTLHFAFFLLVFLAIASSRAAARHRALLARCLAFETALLAAYGIYQVFALARGWPSGWEFLNRHAWHPLRAQGLVWRATAIFEEPKWLAIHLLFGIPWTYAALLAARGNAARAGWTAASVLILGGVVATGSLGILPVCLLLILLAAGDYAVRKRGLSRRLLFAAGAFALFAAVATIALFPGTQATYIRSRISAEARALRGGSSASEYESGYRYAENLQFAVGMFREAPIFGIGLGEFAPVGARRGVALGIPAEFTTDGPWVGAIGFLAEMGLAGAAVVAFLLWRILRRRPASMDDARAVAILLVLGVLGKELSSGFYVHFWTWYPLGVAGCWARLGSVRAEARML